MAQSKAHMEATGRYNKKAYERIAFDVRRDAEMNADFIRARLYCQSNHRDNQA